MLGGHSNRSTGPGYIYTSNGHVRPAVNVPKYDCMHGDTIHPVRETPEMSRRSLMTTATVDGATANLTICNNSLS
jgi:hypothetical protein